MTQNNLGDCSYGTRARAPAGRRARRCWPRPWPPIARPWRSSPATAAAKLGHDSEQPGRLPTGPRHAHGGRGGHALLAEAVTAYRQALEVHTRDTLPQDWARLRTTWALSYGPKASARRARRARRSWPRPWQPIARPWRCAPAPRCRKTGPRLRTTWALSYRPKASARRARRARRSWPRLWQPIARPWRYAPAPPCRKTGP